MPTVKCACVGGVTAVLLAVLAATVAGCGSSASTTAKSGSPSPVASSSLAAAKAQITANWEAFFAGTTPAARKIGLLQNGQEFAKVLTAQAASVLAKGAGARVSAVDLTSPNTATVTYSILFGGQVALADQKGQAVLQGGVWKVTAQSFTALLKLEGQQVPQSSPSPAP